MSTEPSQAPAATSRPPAVAGARLDPVLHADGLTVEFLSHRGPVRIVSDLSFDIGAGDTLSLVGESGCGKSVSVMAMLGLLPRRQWRIDARALRFEGLDLLDPDGRNLRAVRGRRIGMIFQEPMTSLNPTMTVGEQIAEVLRYHLRLDRRAARAGAIRLLDRVRIPRAAERVDDYPFAFSGGMRQRVMIALALACSPALLVADEPTTALDVTVQAEIFALLRELQRETGTALLLITHDLGVVAEMADEVAVMYAGRIVERASTAALFVTPQHPYTIGLLGASPEWETRADRLTPIEGRVPLPSDRLDGCRFAPRCPFRIVRCDEAVPPLAAMGADQAAACWRAPLEPETMQ
jgi:peptide/nickel transport system ATP-binding protein